MFGCVWQPSINEHDDDELLTDFDNSFTVANKVKYNVLFLTILKNLSALPCDK